MKVVLIAPIRLLRGKLCLNSNTSFRFRHGGTEGYLYHRPNPRSWKNEAAVRRQNIFTQAIAQAKNLSDEEREQYQAQYEALPKRNRPSNLWHYIVQQKFRELSE